MKSIVFSVNKYSAIKILEASKILNSIEVSLENENYKYSKFLSKKIVILICLIQMYKTSTTLT